MKMPRRFICSLVLFLGGMTLLSAQSAGEGATENIDIKKDPQVTRIVSFNIRACRGPDDSWGLNPEWAGKVISALNPDAAGIQEVDRNNSRCEWTDQAALLGEMTGLNHYFSKAIDFAGGEYGIGILSRPDALAVRTVALPGSEEPRTLIEAEFDDFVLFNTHLSLSSESRVRSAEIICEELSRYQKPVILTGDMNVEDDREREKLFGEHWTVLSLDEPSFPADQPDCRLDYIMIADPTNRIGVNAPIWEESVTKRGVVPATASDHRPVFVDLDWETVKEGL